MLSPVLIAVLVASFAFEFINGFHDTANAIATTVFTRALPVKVAIVMSACMNFIGALTNEGVAMTVAHGLVDVSPSLYVILAALLGAVTWDLFTWWQAIPTSSSHALIGALVGATLLSTMDLGSVIWEGLLDKVIIPLFTSPVIGFVLGYGCMKLIFWIFANWTPHNANHLFHRLQVLSGMFMAYSHGSNDAQKTMGIITLALITAGELAPGSDIPLWVKLFCATTMAIGTTVGGGRIMKTVGRGVTKLSPVIGFASETSSAIAIEAMSAIGAPVSTTQVLTTSIMGAGTARRKGSVRWNVAKDMVKSWFITLPVTMMLGAGYAFILSLIFL